MPIFSAAKWPIIKILSDYFVILVEKFCYVWDLDIFPKQCDGASVSLPNDVQVSRPSQTVLVCVGGGGGVLGICPRSNP